MAKTATPTATVCVADPVPAKVDPLDKRTAAIARRNERKAAYETARLDLERKRDEAASALAAHEYSKLLAADKAARAALSAAIAYGRKPLEEAEHEVVQLTPGPLRRALAAIARERFQVDEDYQKSFAGHSPPQGTRASLQDRLAELGAAKAAIEKLAFELDYAAALEEIVARVRPLLYHHAVEPPALPYRRWRETEHDYYA